MKKYSKIILGITLLWCYESAFAVPLLYTFTGEIQQVDPFSVGGGPVAPGDIAVGDIVQYQLRVDFDEDVPALPDGASIDYFDVSLVGANYGDGWEDLSGYDTSGYGFIEPMSGFCSSYGCGYMQGGWVQIFSYYQASDWYDSTDPTGLAHEVVFTDYFAGGNAAMVHQGTMQSLTVTSAVPEPASLALLSLGLAGMGFSRRKTM